MPDSGGAVTAYIAVGSNIEPERHIPEAVRLLSAIIPLTGISAFYITPPIDRPEQGDYRNGMLRVECRVAARALKYEVLRPLEAQLGRVRTADKFAARTIDLDVAVFGNAVIRDPDLTLPDPDLLRRPFLAVALLDLTPDFVMPDMGRALADLVDKDALRGLKPAAALTQMLKERFLP